MMILAVETSGYSMSVALLKDGQIASEHLSLLREYTHSEKLMPAVAKVLADAGADVRDVDIFAASAGPGSFTGIRIGVTCAKSMAYALKKPVVAVPTLEILAMNLAGNGAPEFDRICAMIDARNSQAFFGFYRIEAGLPVLDGIMDAGPAADIASRIAESGMRTCIIGSGAAQNRDIFTDTAGKLIVAAPPEADIPLAANAARIAASRSAGGKLNAFDDPAPVYIRKPQAERFKTDANR